MKPSRLAMWIWIAFFAVLLLLTGLLSAQESDLKQTYMPLVANEVQHWPKRGVGATYARYGSEGQYVTCEEMSKAGVYVYHDWSYKPPLCPGIESVATIWCSGSLGKPLGGSSQDVRFYNEPDVGGQCNAGGVGAVVQAYRVAVTDVYPTKQVGSPSYLDVRLLREFVEMYYSRYLGEQWFVPIPFLDLHFYCSHNVPSSIAKFDRDLQDAVALAREKGIPRIIVSEVGCAPCWANIGERGSLEYMRHVMGALGQVPEVEWAAWFQWAFKGTGEPEEPWWPSNCYTGLFTWENEVTAYGREYLYRRCQKADVNKDGIVDILDLTLCGGCFGYGE